VLALSPIQSGSGGEYLGLVDWAGRVRSLPLEAFPFDNQPGGFEPRAGVALSPDERSALVGTSSELRLVHLPTGQSRRLGTPRAPVNTLEWLDARFALLATSRDAVVANLAIVDVRTGRRRDVGQTTSIVVTGRSRAVHTPPGGGITTLAANGVRLSHHAGGTRLALLYPHLPGPYAMAVPGRVELRAGRRVVVDLRTGALVLDKTYDHAPSDAVRLAGT
jgi:hypothetical protein